ncbi:dimethylallyltranstransferase [Flavobacteriaceae bacterium UJ101]|nr:dimethylallyltranstransferase [Flavobacteriaceae bacterium UJ101]
MELFKTQTQFIKNTIEEYQFKQDPYNLYDPLNYILKLGGKHIRPILALSAFELFSDDLDKIKKPAIALEWFHNFTLIHDDIMDDASLRRGNETVHTKWDVNTAILSGDALMIKSYELFEDLEPSLFKKCIQLFTKTAIEVCEGQQYDVDFETRDDVTLHDYIEMITLKTAVLIATSLKIGAMIGKASDEDAENLYQFGKYLGIAFQIQDDYLDIYGDMEKVGKRHAGDIYENKKTILYLKALEKGNAQQKERLLTLYASTSQKVEKVDEVIQLFEALQIPEETLNESYRYQKLALEHLSKVTTLKSKEKLVYLSEYLIKRDL